MSVGVKMNRYGRGKVFVPYPALKSSATIVAGFTNASQGFGSTFGGITVPKNMRMFIT